MQICQHWAYNSNWLELNSNFDIEMSHTGSSFPVFMPHLVSPEHTALIYLPAWSPPAFRLVIPIYIAR